MWPEARSQSCIWLSARCLQLLLCLAIISPKTSMAQQAQTPSAAAVFGGGTTYDNCPYPEQLTHAWGTENQGSPVINVAPSDTRRGIVTSGTRGPLSDQNSASVMAGAGTGPNPEDFFVVSIDKPGDVKFDNALTTGNTKYVRGYQSISLRRIDPATGSTVGFTPMRLDQHVGVCSLPKIVKDNGGNLYIFWKEHSGSGDQVIACHFIVSTNTVDAGPTNIGGGNYYSDIREMQVASDVRADNGAAVIIRNHNGSGDDRIFVQRVHVNAGAFVLQWSDACAGAGSHMLQIGGTGFSCATVAATAKFSPVLAYNAVKGRYDFAWGVASTGKIWAQTVDFGTPYAMSFATGGAATASTIDFSTTTLPIGEYCEFYMQPIKGYISGGIDQGGVVFLYRKDPSNKALVDEYTLNNPTPVRITSQLLPDLTHGSFPCAISKRTVSGTQENAIGIYAMYSSTATPRQFECAVWEWNPGTSVLSSNTSGVVTYSERFESYVGTDAGGFYAVVPDVTGGNIFQLGFGGGGGPTMMYLDDCDVRDIDLAGYPYGRVIQYDDAYYTVAIGALNNSIGFLSFDYGVDQTYPQAWPNDMRYQWASDFTNIADYNHETDEKPREYSFLPNEYNYSGFGYPYTSPTVTGVPVEVNRFEYNPSSSTYDGWTGAAYEEIDGLYNSNIVLGVMTPWVTGTATYQITNVTNGDAVFYQPKVLIGQGFGGSSDYFAIITYIKMTQNPSFSQQYCYNTVDLTTGTIGTETVLQTAPGGWYRPYFRNWDAVHDLNSTGYLFVYGDAYLSPTATPRMSGGEINVATFNGIGAYVRTVTPQIVNGNTFDQVRACYDPDPLNSGAYLVWRQTPSGSSAPGLGNALIQLVQVNTVTGASWGAGILNHGPATAVYRGEPTVCADPSWVYIVWTDYQGVGATSEIYGCPWSNTGAAIPNTVVNGTKLSGTVHEAFNPDVIVNPDLPTTAMVAWDEDCNASSNGYRQIRLMNCPIFGVSLVGTTIALATPHAAVTLPGTYSMTDARWSLYGYMQRRPKLVAVDASSEAFPYDRSGTYSNLSHWILCAFETQAFNLYGSGAGFCTGGTLSGIYSSLWSDELATNYGHASGYLQNNVTARAVNPNLTAGANPNKPLIGGEIAIAANTNAQDLWSIGYSTDMGPVVGILDYVNTAQTNAIARAVIARPIYVVPPIGGPLLTGTWTAPTDSHPTGPAVQNPSWMPMFFHPAAGSPTTGVTSGTWTINASYSTMTFAPYMLNVVGIDYVSPGIGANALVLTGHIENIAGQWPLSGPDSWGMAGNTTLGQGVGYKKSSGRSVADGSLAIAINDNPTGTKTNAVITGIAGRTAQVRVLNVLGSVVQRTESVSIVNDGTRVRLNVDEWPSGNYIVEAIGDEGSHASATLTVAR
jgi:hypothetical protein